MSAGKVFLVLACLGAWAGATYHSRPSVPSNVKVFPAPRANEDKAFWYAEGQAELAQSLARSENNNVAKNVILFVGAGMSLTTVTAGRIYKGQQLGQSGEDYKLVWEDFPDAALIKTYDVDKQVSDGASSATALMCGVKTNYYVTGYDSSVTRDDCTSVTVESKVSSVAEWALSAGKRTGFVTTTRISDGTPGALYAHSASRDWECDASLPTGTGVLCPDAKDIARQLIEDNPGTDFNVIMGGGYSSLSGDAVATPADPINNCLRADGRNLFEEWKTNQEAKGRKYTTARTLTDLKAINVPDVDYILGVFANDHLPYEHVKRELSLDLPTLADMTESAINILGNGGDSGYFLLVDAGTMDDAHDANMANTALDEAAAFDDAIRKALSLVNVTETLVVVTTDHSQVATFNGYPSRGQDITGFSSNMDDGLPLPTITYSNGPGWFNAYVVDGNGNVARRDLTGDDVTSLDYVKPAGANRLTATHGGEDVALYAVGPMSHLFQRTHEQSFVAHAMAYAACIGPNLGHCAQH